jgi:hypothetical protein
MPEFDPNKLSAPERAAWIDRLKGDSPKWLACSRPSFGPRACYEMKETAQRKSPR